MGNNPTTRSRAYKEGWLGRRQNYVCHECNVRFQANTLNPLPEIDRVCPDCKKRTYVYTFTNKQTGRETRVRASGIELATLRAWAISPNLTFKMPQPEGIAQ